MSEKSISYGKLLHQVIAHKAPPEFFEILLQQPGIDPNLKNDQGQTPAHSILEKILQSTSEESTSEGSGSDESTSDEYEKEEGTIYFQYLKYLLLEFHSKLEYKAILEIVKSHQPTQNNNLKKISKLLNDIKKMLEEKDGAPQNEQTLESYLAKVIQEIEQSTHSTEELTKQIVNCTAHIPPDPNTLTRLWEHAYEEDLLF